MFHAIFQHGGLGVRYSWWKITTVALLCFFLLCPPRCLVGVLTRQNTRLSRSQTPSDCSSSTSSKHSSLFWERDKSPGSFSKWFLLLLQEHWEALGYAVLQVAHSTPKTSTAREQAWPQLQQCLWHRPAHSLEQPAQPAGTAVGISKSTSVKAWAEIYLATSGHEVRAVRAMPTGAAASPACCDPTYVNVIVPSFKRHLG